ncbi:MAG: hypothetical protein KGJ02_03660 [Verrucomicrobiota bacterium]|nr:hypothetical protein [Verrucomicrobiota bacterium]
MNSDLKIFAIKLAGVLLATHLMGWGIMLCAESFEKAWKAHQRQKNGWCHADCFYYWLFLAAGFDKAYALSES